MKEIEMDGEGREREVQGEMPCSFRHDPLFVIGEERRGDCSFGGLYDGNDSFLNGERWLNFQKFLLDLSAL